MTRWKIRQTVDLAKPLLQNVLKANMPHMMEGDKAAFEWIISVVENGAYVDLTEFAVHGHFCEANGGGTVTPIQGEIKNNVCTIPFGAHTVNGPMRGVVKLTKDDVQITIAVGEFYVHEALG